MQAPGTLERASDPILSLQHRLRLTGIVSSAISLLGTVVMLATLYLLFRAQPGQSYYQVIQSLTLSQERLVPAMMLAGSAIAILAGLITWLIVLYSSHRVAGPLYRFSKNLELEIGQGPITPVQLRRDDSFQTLSARLAGAADSLESYYEDQLRLVEALTQCVEAEDAQGVEQYRKRLCDLAGRARGLE